MQMLTVDTAANHLLAQNLITADALVEGELEITSASRRNRNLKVSMGGGGGLFIKQPGDRQSGAGDTLAREAVFYTFCQHEPAVAEVLPFLPRLIRADLGQSMLILELLREGKPLWRHYQEPTATESPEALAAAVGRALATVHRTFRAPALLTHPQLAFLDARAPWALEILRPTPQMLSYLSGAQLDLIRTLQGQPEVPRALNRLRRMWRPETVIHGDIKADNFVVVPSGSGHQEHDLYLIDWELVQRGDPAWDLGGAMHDFLHVWVQSMDHTAPLEAMAEGARRPLPAMHPAIHALWSAYCRHTGPAPTERRELLRRTVRYSAVRVIQSAFELAGRLPVMAAASVLLLQIAVNLLHDPVGGLAVLYGLTEEGDPA